MITPHDRLQVHLKSPWSVRIETNLAVFSNDIPLEKADALLCEWAPSPELFTFPRRRAWYCCEPACQFRFLGDGNWQQLKERLAPHEFLWHGHPDPRYRVPHITHFQRLSINRNPERSLKAVAIVSNHGGHPLRAHPDIRFRNRLITHPLVDLYGRSSWQNYKPSWYSLRRPPRNYKGEVPGDWPTDEKRKLISAYKVCLCLENMNERGYFTEKFVEAVQAGCIPVYRASADIRTSVLKGAAWIDPADFPADSREAISAALNACWSEHLDINDQWLRNNPSLSATHASEVFNRLAMLLTCSH